MDTTSTWHLDFAREEDLLTIIPNPPTQWINSLPHSDIFIWKFDNAPKELRELSINGGDEDWLVVMKKDFANQEYLYLLRGIGVCCIDCFEIGDWVMLIGSHS